MLLPFLALLVLLLVFLCTPVTLLHTVSALLAPDVLSGSNQISFQESHLGRGCCCMELLLRGLLVATSTSAAHIGPRSCSSVGRGSVNR